MDPVSEKAKSLAEAVTSDPRTTALRAARQALAKDAEAAALQERYHRVVQQIQDLERARRPVEPPLKREAATLGEQVRHSPVLQALLRAHADFTDMMDAVTKTIGDAMDRALE
jgi:cell fate (sporulation/competence/biofilm development) regulator YlbF (YheA/YmcA/DUF963 family)